MELIFVLLLLWALLCMPLGYLAHWAILGGNAQKQALPLVPLTGLALTVLVLDLAGRFGMEMGGDLPVFVLLLVWIPVGLLIWKKNQLWRSRSLLAAGLLVLLAAFLFNAFIDGAGEPGSGPLGRGTGRDPVTKVSQIQSLVDEASKSSTDTGESDVDAGLSAFQRFAAFTVGLGAKNESSFEAWSAYSLIATIVALFASLTMLPIYVLMRWWEIKWFGNILVTALGVLSPSAVLAMALGETEIIVAAPFVIASVAAAQLSVREYGWYAVGAVSLAAGTAIAGPVVVLPAVFAWCLHRFFRSKFKSAAPSDIGKKKIHVDAFIAAAIALGCISMLPAVLEFKLSAMVPWRPIFSTASEAILGWPFAWLGGGFAVGHPEVGHRFDPVIWMVGPGLIIISIAYSVSMKVVRELAAVLTVVVMALLALAAFMVGADDFGGRLFTLVAVTCTPLLVMAAVRMVSLARDAARDRSSRLGGVGPFMLFLVFALYSASSVVATAGVADRAPRFDGTPVAQDLSVKAGSKGQTSLILSREPWLPYIIGGVPKVSTAGDIDELVSADARIKGVYAGENHRIALPQNPLLSDPPYGWQRTGRITPFGVRLFKKAEIAPGASRSVVLKHEAVEKKFEYPRDFPAAGRAGGALLPISTPEVCFPENAVGTCDPKEPVVGGVCSDDDIDAATTTLPVKKGQKKYELLGVNCWKVSVAESADTILFHLRDVGVVFPAGSAIQESGARLDDDAGNVIKDKMRYAIYGGGRMILKGPSGSGGWGNDRLNGVFDVTVEGDFGSEMQAIATSDSYVDPAAQTPGIPLGWAADGFSPAIVDWRLSGSARFKVGSSGNAKVGRVFARPTDMPPSCDVVMKLKDGGHREMQFTVADNTASVGPGGGQNLPGENPSASRKNLRPALTFHVTRAPESGEATLIVGTYLQRNGVARHVLLDWTAQFDGNPVGASCDLTPQVN